MSIVGRIAKIPRFGLRPLRNPRFSINPTHCANDIKGVNDIARPTASIRQFHASQPKQSEVLDICMSQAHNVFASIHDIIGLPWVLALPLTAFLVRLCLITPFNIYSLVNVRRQIALQPLVYAWSRPIALRVIKEYGTKDENYQEKMIKKALRGKRRELYKRFGIKRWPTFAPFINFPIWLVFMETIRRMCGTHDGLLGLFAKTFNNSKGDDAEVILSPIETNFISAYHEPSMAIEGALWFPDLLVPDPMLILPFALSACFYATIVQQNQKIVKRTGALTKWQGRRSRISKLVVLAIGPLTLHLPSAMLVYWMASSLTTLGQTLLLDFLLPLPPAMLPSDAGQRQSQYTLGTDSNDK